MAKKHWIYIKRGLSEDPKHRARMGEAIWVFMHMLDRADWETGIVYDWKDKDEADEMGMNARTMTSWRQRLDELGYIKSVKGQHKQDIIIHNWIDPRDYGGKVLNVDFESTIQTVLSKKTKVETTPQSTVQTTPQTPNEPLENETSFIESKIIDHIYDPAFEEEEKKPPARRTDAKKKGDLMDGILAHAGRSADPVLDYPADVQNALREFVRLWMVPVPPPPVKGSKGSDYADWISGLRDLMSIAGEQFLEGMKATHANWNNHPFTVSRPGALSKTLRAEIGILNQKKAHLPEGPKAESEPERKIVPIPPKPAFLSKGFAK